MLSRLKPFAQLCTGAIALGLFAAAAQAGEITLRMKGGDFELSGQLKSYDLKTYTIDTELYGRMSFKAERFECVAGDCPTGAVKPSVFRANTSLEGADLGTTTWVGGSAIGTTFMPTLIESFASSVGARVEKEVGADPRNISFKLLDRANGQMGQINIQRLGVPAGFDALSGGKADVVWSGRPVSEEEADKLADAGIRGIRSPGSEHIWANDALVVLVSKENPAVSLSIEAIALIFAGKIKNWSQVGFPPGPIKVYAPSAQMGTWGQFENSVLKPRGLTLTEDAVRLDHANEWADRVAADPLGISASTIAFVREARALNIEQSCGLVSRPTIFGAKTDEYPLTRQMYFYSAGTPRSRMAQALLEFALSNNVQEALKAANFVDQAAETLPFTQQGSRIAYALNAEGENYDQALMRDFIKTLRGGERVSTTFRFEPASIQLDVKSREQIKQLRELMKSSNMKDRSFMLLGFSDAVGAFTSNLDLSLRRAESVLSALGNTEGAAKPETRGFGELAPVACNDTNGGRSLNRRVEVWVK